MKPENFYNSRYYGTPDFHIGGRDKRLPRPLIKTPHPPPSIAPLKNTFSDDDDDWCDADLQVPKLNRCSDDLPRMMSVDSFSKNWGDNLEPDDADAVNADEYKPHDPITDDDSGAGFRYPDYKISYHPPVLIPDISDFDMSETYKTEPNLKDAFESFDSFTAASAGAARALDELVDAEKRLHLSTCCLISLNMIDFCIEQNDYNHAFNFLLTYIEIKGKLNAEFPDTMQQHKKNKRIFINPATFSKSPRK